MATAAHGLALMTAVATLVLILFGGLVTNTGSALAVPDWPTTFGHNLFLYPWSQMVGGIFYEHSHRLLGVLVGLLTLALAAALWRAGGRLRALGLVAATTVVAQGVLGGLRVVLLEPTLAILHGCLAPAFFALVAVAALVTSPRWQEPATAEALAPSTRSVTLAVAALVYVQIVFGALLTHAGFLQPHLIGALAVFALAPIATARLRGSGDAVAAPVARALLALLGAQLLLGVGSLLVRVLPGALPDGLGLILTVAHRLAGALTLGAAVVLAARAWAPRARGGALVAVVELTA
ncbi:MAG TPA: COX15/CtaA family protein [Methylomirabilota bacterium]|jgi:cytochrome c oxidase assembly protein subunit 15|nr:COX15/CtaA family protein [Methylomirabilota bacterium]